MRARSAFAAGVMLIIVASLALRIAWLRSDPPTVSPLGIVWHDEGAWVHNARNRALWGTWRTDAWNPVFVTPVFTALEYGAFSTFGVGVWQARVVPAVSGVLAVGFLMAGLAAYAGRRAALVGGALLATNYVFVMWNRAALIESTMTAFIVVSWAAVAKSNRGAFWGAAAGVAAGLAWFTKASAAFFIASVVLISAVTIVTTPAGRPERKAAFATLSALGLTFLVIGALFVWPNWQEYRFYNWQMSVLRKPEFSLAALIDRASWLPVVQGTFARALPVLVVASLGVVAIAARGLATHPADRLLLLWLLAGLVELVIHDSGNERRYVMFVPVLVALAARTIDLTAPLLPDRREIRSGLARAIGAGLLLGLGYVVAGSVCRLLFESDVTAGRLSFAVRLAAAVAVAGTTAALLCWNALVGRLAAITLPKASGAVLVAVSLAWNLPDYSEWLHHRAEKNYEASVALGHVLPPATLVQGKLANGMALESTIRPVFVGNGFGNHDDRLRRSDVHYLLTYDLPRIGYESSDGSGLIDGILEHYPRRRIVATFEVDEAPGVERAALFDKGPEDALHDAHK